MLSNGLKFVPSPITCNEIQYKTDIRKFCDKIEKFEFFNDRVQNKEDSIQNDLFSNPSRWQPPSSKDSMLNNIIHNIKLQTMSPQKNNKNKSNIPLHQREALDKLMKNTDIVIKSADKGGATIIIDKIIYHSCMQKILDNRNTYSSQNVSLSVEKLKSKTIKFIKDNKMIFTEKEYKYLTIFNARLAYIYGLPKIHKCQKLKSIIRTKSVPVKHGVLTVPFCELKVPFRPIVSGKMCPVSRLCELAKLILRPFEQSIPHLVIDSRDFIRKLPKQLMGRHTLVAIDVVQLYPSIDNNLGREALLYWFDLFPEKFFRNFSSDFTIKLIDFIQDNVYFKFNDLLYKQLEGTAMGKSQAPQYANLTIAYLILTKACPIIAQKYGEAAATHIKENIFLFLDDGFIILNESLISASDLLIILNSIDDKLKFTMDTSKKELAFLDVLIKLINIDNSILYTVSTDIYYKETDSFNYFPFKSCAPRHITRNIPYNLARRIATIVSDISTRDIRLEELKPKLLKKKYPHNLIEDGINRAKGYDREELLKKTEKTKIENLITLVTEHNPTVKNPAAKITQNFKNLKNIEKVKNGKRIMPKFIHAKRQPPNLLRSLSLSLKRDHTNNDQSEQNGITFVKCNDKRCLLCTIVIDSPTYKTKNGTILKRNFKMTCKSRDLVYLLMCFTCLSEYLGETGNKINLRTNVHRNQIEDEDYRKLKCSKHIHKCGHNKFKIFPFHQCFQNCHFFREEKEKYFRNIVKPELH